MSYVILGNGKAEQKQISHNTRLVCFSNNHAREEAADNIFGKVITCEQMGPFTCSRNQIISPLKDYDVDKLLKHLALWETWDLSLRYGTFLHFFLTEWSEIVAEYAILKRLINA